VLERLAAGARRFAIVLVVVAVGTLFVSLVLGLLAGSTLSRAVSVGFYVVGSFLAVAGFFVGNRGPVNRTDPKGKPSFFGTRFVVRSREEREETISDSAVFVAVGFALLLLGMISDSRFPLF
jgi:hypothetical protein